MFSIIFFLPTLKLSQNTKPVLSSLLSLYYSEADYLATRIYLAWLNAPIISVPIPVVIVPERRIAAANASKLFLVETDVIVVAFNIDYSVFGSESAAVSYSRRC